MSLVENAWKKSFSYFSMIILLLFTFFGLFSVRLPCCPLKFPIYMINSDGLITNIGKSVLIFMFALLGKFLGNLFEVYRTS